MRAVEPHVLDAIVRALDPRGLQTRGDVLGHLGEDGDLALDGFLLLAVLHVPANILDESLLGPIVHDTFPERARGVEILGADFTQERDRSAGKVAMQTVQVDGALLELDGLDAAQIVGTRPLVEEGHVAVALEVPDGVAHARLVDGQLLVVDTDTVTVRIRVGEQSRLQDGIGRGLDARGHVSWVEGDLLDLGEVVLRVLVQGQLADLAKGELSLGPDVRHVEHVDLLLLPELFGLLGGHGLHLHRPGGVVALLDGLVEILLRVVGGLLAGLFLRHELGALVAEDVELGVDPLAVLVEQLDGVTEVAVHEAPSVGDASIAEEDHDLVDGLGVLRQVVPEGGGVVHVCQVRRWVALLGVDEDGELRRVAEEEHGSVVGNDIPVAFFSSELDGETARVTRAVVRSRLAAHGGEANRNGALCSLLEDVGLAEILEGFRRLEGSMGTTTLGVDDALRNALAVEVGEEINQMEILQQERAILSYTLNLVRVWHRDAIAGAVHDILSLAVSIDDIAVHAFLG
jgi:hypothetical protein